MEGQFIVLNSCLIVLCVYLPPAGTNGKTPSCCLMVAASLSRHHGHTPDAEDGLEQWNDTGFKSTSSSATVPAAAAAAATRQPRFHRFIHRRKQNNLQQLKPAMASKLSPIILMLKSTTPAKKAPEKLSNRKKRKWNFYQERKKFCMTARSVFNAVVIFVKLPNFFIPSRKQAWKQEKGWNFKRLIYKKNK